MPDFDLEAQRAALGDVREQNAQKFRCIGLDACNEIERLRSRLERAENVMRDVLEDLEDRYDGAPDAGCQWMAHLMVQIRAALGPQASEDTPG